MRQTIILSSVVLRFSPAWLFGGLIDAPDHLLTRSIIFFMDLDRQCDVLPTMLTGDNTKLTGDANFVGFWRRPCWICCWRSPSFCYDVLYYLCCSCFHRRSLMGGFNYAPGQIIPPTIFRWRLLVIFNFS